MTTFSHQFFKTGYYGLAVFNTIVNNIFCYLKPSHFSKVSFSQCENTQDKYAKCLKKSEISNMVYDIVHLTKIFVILQRSFWWCDILSLCGGGILWTRTSEGCIAVWCIVLWWCCRHVGWWNWTSLLGWDLGNVIINLNSKMHTP